jgi:hypothetical protein
MRRTNGGSSHRSWETWCQFAKSVGGTIGTSGERHSHLVPSPSPSPPPRLRPTDSCLHRVGSPRMAAASWLANRRHAGSAVPSTTRCPPRVSDSRHVGWMEFRRRTGPRRRRRWSPGRCRRGSRLTRMLVSRTTRIDHWGFLGRRDLGPRISLRTSSVASSMVAWSTFGERSAKLSRARRRSAQERAIGPGGGSNSRMRGMA